MPAGPIQSIPNMKVTEIAGSRPEGQLKANPNAAKLAAGEGKRGYATSQTGTLAKNPNIPQGRTLAKADGTVVARNVPTGPLAKADGTIVSGGGGGGKGILIASGLKPNPLGDVVSGGGSTNLVSKATSALVKNPNADNLKAGVIGKASEQKGILAKNPNASNLKEGIIGKASAVPSQKGVLAPNPNAAKYATLFGNLPKKL